MMKTKPSSCYHLRMSQKERSDTKDEILTGTFHDREDELQLFLKKHSTWLSKFDGDQPIYCLPKVVIETLKRRTISKRNQSFIDEKEATSEEAFTQLCDNYQSVGVWNGTPISCALLKPPAHPLSAITSLMPWWNDAANAAELNALTDRLAQTRERLKGIAGWLMTDHSFLSQLAELKQEYEAINVSKRPVFPLTRTVVAYGSKSDSKTAKGFHSSLVNFFNRFGLMQLVTWELPEPQGPYFSDPLPANSPARPERGLYLYIPLSYPVTRNDDLLEMISRRQLEMARSLKMDERLARLTSHVTYSHAFAIDFLDRAIQSRFKTEPRGLVAAIQEAASRVINKQESYVKELRTEIAARKAGRLKKVRTLK